MDVPRLYRAIEAGGYEAAWRHWTDPTVKHVNTEYASRITEISRLSKENG